MTFLTRFKDRINGKVYAGANIKANSWKEASRIAGEDLVVIGELTYECKCNIFFGNYEN